MSAAAALADASGARLAWVPRRAGDRGAVEAGCLPSLLPGARPVVDPAARADLAAAWGVASLPAEPGRDTAAILAAAADGTLAGLLVGGVDPADLPDPAVAHAALDRAFVVSLEVRTSGVTERADVVLPVAPAVEKSGTFVTWEGRLRPFPRVLEVAGSLPDVRVLAGIADELGQPLGFRAAEGAMTEMTELGPWDGARVAAPTVAPGRSSDAPLVLDTWRQLVDVGRLQDGADSYRATARPPVVRASLATLAEAGLTAGALATVVTAAGERVTYPAEAADLPDGVVWVPATAEGHLHAVRGEAVELVAGEVAR